LVITALIRTEIRIRALLFAVALSMGFHSSAEGIKFVLTGGSHKIWGPGSSIIGDNNQFALAIIMVIPILIYLYIHSRNRLIRIGIGMGIFLQIIAVIGTGSRGGLIGIAALGMWTLVTTKRKIRYLLVVLLMGSVALSMAPERWYARMGTIDSATQDDAFMGRVIAWKINVLAALDHPFIGAGFRSTQNIAVWRDYSNQFSRLNFIPTSEPSATFARAAHSIYFQVLGDMGIVGLSIFIALLFVAWRNASVVMARTRDRIDLKWANDLARALQYCLVPYIVSGAALSMAYFDLSYAIFGLLAVLRARTETLPIVTRIPAVSASASDRRDEWRLSGS
jgi:probable O-glycosylation ligase, exosortase system type 1-associated